MRRTAALIAGGGPAGAAVAIRLARGGVRPLLIERRHDSRDVVCGGFLGADAIAGLASLGIDPMELGARPIRRVRIAAGERIAETSLPFAAAGLSRGALDAALLARAAGEGAIIERGVSVRRVDREARRLTLGDGGAVAGGALFLATGKHELRGGRRAIAAARAPAVGLRIGLAPSLRLAAALEDVIELHLFRHGYAGLLLTEDGSVNLCLSIAQSRLKAAGGEATTLMAALAQEAPLLAERFGTAAGGGIWSSVARIPYGWRATQGEPGVFRLGDQSAVIASLAGDGIAIALASAAAAAQYFLDGGASASIAYQADFSRRVRRPIEIANALRRWGERPAAAKPLVSLFSHLPSLVRHAARSTRTEPPIAGYVQRTRG